MKELMSYHCSICKKPLSQEVHKLSIDRYGKPLCFLHQEAAEPRHCCSECNATITHNVYKFSLRHFEKPLCRDCQPEPEEKFSAAPPKFRGTYKVNTWKAAWHRPTMVQTMDAPSFLYKKRWGKYDFGRSKHILVRTCKSLFSGA